MNRLANQLLSKRFYLLVLAHVAIFTVAYELAYQLRFEWIVPDRMRTLFWQTLPGVVLVQLTFFQFCGSLHGWWRHVTFADLALLLNAATLSLITVASIDYLLIPQFQISRAVLLLDWGATILLLGGMRSACRLVGEHVWPSFRSGSNLRPVLMVGSGQQAASLTPQIHAHPRLNFRVVGFLDDNPAHYGSLLAGVPIVGSPDSAVKLCQQRNIRDILVLANSIPGARLRKLMDGCRQAQIQLKIIPSLDELVDRGFRLQVRDVDINDLLRRPPVKLDTQAIEQMLAQRRVMVTGAGGSIGSEICRQLLKCELESLLLVERTENSLFHIERELAASRDRVDLIPCIADIRDEERMRSLLRQYRPHLVFHCAAHKHVPLMEENPGEAIKNNVLGTVTLVKLADEFAVERFVMISTDKAVNPTSVMGASKQLAERYVHASSETSATKFVVVRFGNVLASAGSVVPIFQDQIRRGGPVTVTHPEMRRYFMTIPEASQLVLQAAAMGKGGEIFVLDMGKPVKIMDLARDLIRLSGLRPDDIEIRITGRRPGEKLYEELYFDEEQTLETHHPKLRVAWHRPDDRGDVLAAIAELQTVLHEPAETIRTRLMKVSPEYRPQNGSAPEEIGETAGPNLLTLEGS